MNCLFCDYELDFSGPLAYCHNHDPIRVIYSKPDKTEGIYFYLMSNRQYRIIVYPNKHFEIEVYTKDESGRLGSKFLAKIDEICEITPINFETKVSTLVTFL